MLNLNSKYDDLFQMELELINSKQREIVSNCESLNQIYNIFLQGYEILDKHICLHSQLKINQSLLTRNAVYKYEIDLYMKDLNYYLYTFLSSVKSLIDQTRVHCRKFYKENELFKEYNINIKEHFAKNPFTKFIESLRNFIVHYQILSIVSERSIEDNQNQVTLSLFLEKEALLKSGWDWDNKGKEYLEQMNPKEPLQKLISMYFEKVVEFHNWYMKRQYDVFRVEYDYVNHTNAKIQVLGITLSYESFQNQKSFSQEKFESVFFRYLYSKDVHQIMKISDIPSRGALLYSKLNEIKIPPPMLTAMIVATYQIDPENFRT